MVIFMTLTCTVQLLSLSLTWYATVDIWTPLLKPFSFWDFLSDQLLLDPLVTTSTIFAITGKFFASNAYGIIYTVTSEIFPTDARTTGVSLGSMAARVGGMLSPLMLQVQTYVPWFTQTLFGILCCTAGVLCLMYPETSKIDYLTTMDEAEKYYKDNMTVLKFFKKKRRYSYNSEISEHKEYKESNKTKL